MKFDVPERLIRRHGSHKRVGVVLIKNLEISLLASYPHSRVWIARRMLIRGADLELLHEWDTTALVNSAVIDTCSNGDLCQFLIMVGAEIDARDCRNRTPLYWATQLEYLKTCALLFIGGADPHAMSDYGPPMEWIYRRYKDHPLL